MGFVNRTDVTVAYLDNGQKSFIIFPILSCCGIISSTYPYENRSGQSHFHLDLILFVSGGPMDHRYMSYIFKGTRREFFKMVFATLMQKF